MRIVNSSLAQLPPTEDATVVAAEVRQRTALPACKVTVFGVKCKRVDWTDVLLCVSDPGLALHGSEAEVHVLLLHEVLRGPHWHPSPGALCHLSAGACGQADPRDLEGQLSGPWPQGGATLTRVLESVFFCKCLPSLLVQEREYRAPSEKAPRWKTVPDVNA